LDSDANGTVDCPADRRRQRDQDDLRALAADSQHPVSVLFTEVADIRAGCLEDPQPQQAEQGHEREVAGVGGLACRGEQGFELQVRESGRGRFCRYRRRPADMLCWGVLQHAIEDAGPVKAGGHREPPRHGRGA
jgi:hypothetical protein